MGNKENEVMLISPADPLREALTVIGNSLEGASIPWLVGGSTGLLLQGVALNRAPRDLDLYVDAKHAASMHQALRAFATDQQVSSQTGIYRSILSHYDIAGCKVELVGGFEVRSLHSEYIVEAQFLYEHAAQSIVVRSLDETPLEVRLMPLMHELIFNVLRDRPDRYEAIASFCRSVHRTDHEKLLDTLLIRNRMAEPLAEKLRQLLAQEGAEA
ncbi:nucleotidyltransferase domain-containing protein [Paenibacillus silviterrae]|uniref:nucleotidyltransferase domain-containing protein n=1 Tax=Paenibacillus silviterrae TaxID=3242194 RepID=UPI002543E768|nr:hypothetical protein [Paenibacillus chinjuensis]